MNMKVWAVQHSILSWGSFCLNYCSNAAWHGVDQSVALLRCYESPGCSDSGLQLFCIVGSGISHLPLHNKVGQQQEAWSALKLPGIRLLLTLDLRKHSGTNTSRWHGTPNFTLDLKQRGFCASPLFLQTLWPWFPKEMQNLLSSENITLDHSAAVQSFLSLAQARRFWRCLLFKSGLTQGMRQLKPMSCIRLCVVVLEALTPAAVHSLWISPTFLNGFCFTILSRVRLSLLLVHFFSTTSFPSLRLSINVLGHRALWTASLFCNDLLCLALLVQGVNGRLLDNCQVSSLPHDCVAYRTRLRDHLKAFAGVLS